MEKSKIILLVAFTLLISLSYAAPKKPYVSQDIISLTEQDNKVDVIIKFREPAHKIKPGLSIRKAAIQSAQSRIIPGLHRDGVKLKNKFKYVNAVSASLDKKTLARLRNNPNVEAIYMDQPVVLFLDNSTRTINATDFWNTQINGLPINGTGETVCVIDTGIDYTHHAFGSCNIVNYTQEGNNESFLNESAHPYPHDSEKVFKINYTGFSRIAVHFVNISMEAEWDFIELLDPNNSNNTIAVYTGFHEDIWTPPVEGDTIYVRLDSDLAYNDYGFKIDQVINGSVNTSINWSTCDKVIGGWDFSADNPADDDQDPRDDHGHGSHTSGIVASINATYPGVARGAKIVSVKSFDSSGTGANVTDIVAAMEFCIENKERLNISVISMSLGTTSTYSSACDDVGALEFSSPVAQMAIENGIFVVAASGNFGSGNSISWPACLENVTSVGATTKSDGYYSNNNNASFLDVLAPGVDIWSAQNGGGFVTDTGTSMATPHVAGAATLMMQFKKQENGSVLQPLQIRDVLKNTGVDISQTYADRINLTAALNAIDDTPRMTFIQVVTNNTNISQNFTFVNITFSEPLLNATIEIDLTNYSMAGSNTNFYYNITGLSDTVHNFTVYIKDTTHNVVSSALYIFEVDTIKPNITNIQNISVNATRFQILFNTSEASNATIYYGISSGVYNLNITNTSYLTEHNFTLTGLSVNTTYYYYLEATDFSSNRNETSEFNFTTVFADIQAPSWSTLVTFPQNNSVYDSSQFYQFNITWSDYNLSRVWIEHDFTGSFQNYSVNNTANSYYYNYTQLAAGNYSWKMYSNDTMSNLNYTPYFSYVVIKANSSINLTLNLSESNWSLQPSESLDINVTLLSGEGNIGLYKNNELINYGQNISNRTSFTTGNYNISAIYNETQNYSSSFKLYIVNVSDTDPPIVLITNPTNYSFVSTNFVLNITTNEISTCDFSFNGIYNASLADNQISHTLTVSLTDNTYNLTVNCTDSAGYTTIAYVVNFTIDSINPALNLVYPSNSVIISTYTVELNYSLNETNLDRVWYTRNYNLTKLSLTPNNMTGGNNLENITFSRAGKQIISIYVNDSVAHIVSQNTTFFINLSQNIAEWTTAFNNTLSQVKSVSVLNATGITTDNISLYQDLSLELNLTNLQVYVYNFSGMNAIWDFFFDTEDSNSDFESYINTNYGTNPVDYIYIRNFSYYLNNSGDYYGLVKLPSNISYYDSIYYCANDYLSDCQTISACQGIYNEVNTSACYNSTPDNVFVYVPHFSAIFGDNDTIAPEINITTPQNNSVVNTSYQNYLIFSTNEDSSCKYSLNSASYTSVSGTRYFSAQYDTTSNSPHNITVNCTDGQSPALATIYFTINDTSAPVISSLSDSSDTDSISISFNTNEPANHSIVLDGDTETASLRLSHSETFTGLSDDTSYSYNITVCDTIGNCASTLGSESTDPTVDEDDSGSSGSSTGTSTSPTVSYAKVNQLWFNPEKGDNVMNIPSAALAFTQLTFTLKNDIKGTVMISLSETDLPSNIPNLQDIVYQYLRIDKTLLTDNDISSVEIKFNVDKSWIRSKNIDADTVSLYRYTSHWTKMHTTKISEDSSKIYYEALSPGLSFFGIAGRELEIVEVEPIIEENITEEDEPEIIAEVTKGAQPGLKTTEEKPQEIKIPWIILPFVLIIGGFAIIFLFIMKQRGMSILEDKDLKDLRKYVQQSMQEGIEFEYIKNALLKVGWSESIIDLVLHDVHIPIEDTAKIVSYIKYMRNNNKSDAEIRELLKRASWQDQVIEQALKAAEK